MSSAQRHLFAYALRSAACVPQESRRAGTANRKMLACEATFYAVPGSFSFMTHALTDGFLPSQQTRAFSQSTQCSIPQALQSKTG